MMNFVVGDVIDRGGGWSFVTKSFHGICFVE